MTKKLKLYGTDRKLFKKIKLDTAGKIEVNHESLEGLSGDDHNTHYHITEDVREKLARLEKLEKELKSKEESKKEI